VAGEAQERLAGEHRGRRGERRRCVDHLAVVGDDHAHAPTERAAGGHEHEPLAHADQQPGRLRRRVVEVHVADGSDVQADTVADLRPDPRGDVAHEHRVRHPVPKPSRAISEP
jgi:hypothetical protein